MDRPSTTSRGEVAQPAGVLIAMISSPVGQGGIATHVTAVADLLISKGRRVRVVHPASGAPTPLLLTVARALRRTRVEATVLFDRWWRRRFLEVALRRVFRDAPPQVVYAQDPVAAFAALRARTASRTPVVMVVHYNESQADELVERGHLTRGRRTERAIRAFEAMVIAQLDGIVFVSDFMRQSVQRKVPIASQVRSAVIPNFLPELEAQVPAQPVLRDLIMVGGLIPRKNQAYLLHVLEAARAAGRRLDLTVVGAGPDLGRLQGLAAQLGVADQIRFTGHLDDVNHVLAEHRVYVHSATMENAPFAIIEALRLGLPVVFAPVGGIPELIGPSEAGRTWDLASPQAGAAVLCELIDDPAALGRSSRAARARFDEKFRAEVVGDRLLEFLGLTQRQA